ncbi:hypothetical protein WAI453_012417 [Rhynchosporium graminicola]
MYLQPSLSEHNCTIVVSQLLTTPSIRLLTDILARSPDSAPSTLEATICSFEQAFYEESSTLSRQHEVSKDTCKLFSLPNTKQTPETAPRNSFHIITNNTSKFND